MMDIEELTPDLLSPIFDAFSKAVDKQYIYLCDMKTNVWRWSLPAVEYFGLPGEYVPELPELWMAKVHPEDRERTSKAFGDMFSGVSPEHSCEYRVKNAQGQYVWVLCRGCMVQNEGEDGICAGILTNLGQKNKFDENTGLYSNHEFQDAVWKLTEDGTAKTGFLMFSIDFFRRINENGQYALGDALLHVFARQLMKLAPEGGCFYRLEGDRFAFLYPGAGEDTLLEIFEKITKLGEAGLHVQGRTVAVTITGGAVIFPQAGVERDVLSCLEYSYDSARKYNRGGLIFFTEQLQQQVMWRASLSRQLRESVKNHCEGFSLCFQPLVSGDAGRSLVGAEALLRWKHPDFPDLSPAVFVPLLEEAGDINIVGRWVLSNALKQVKEWQKTMPSMKISVNVSFVQFGDGEFKNFVLEELERYDFPKDRLVLELTESCNVIHPAELNRELEFFRSHGIQIALDDFGTGYASLSMLRDLSADWIKVDHTFVAEIAESSFDQALTEALISLCRKLNLNVCVEGIETEKIEQVIKEYRPTVLQGYYYSKPIPGEEFERLYILK